MMKQNLAAVAEAYYKAVGAKDIKSLEKYLHPDVQFIAPLAKTKGKDAVLESTKSFTAFLKTLTIRTTLGSDDQAAVVYDVDCPAPIGNIPTVSLMTFREGLISKIELFYDARPFEKK
jgi:ketosteroid isomerase-like protein